MEKTIKRNQKTVSILGSKKSREKIKILSAKMGVSMYVVLDEAIIIYEKYLKEKGN